MAKIKSKIIWRDAISGERIFEFPPKEVDPDDINGSIILLKAPNAFGKTSFLIGLALVTGLKEEDLGHDRRNPDDPSSPLNYEKFRFKELQNSAYVELNIENGDQFDIIWNGADGFKLKLNQDEIEKDRISDILREYFEVHYISSNREIGMGAVKSILNSLYPIREKFEKKLNKFLIHLEGMIERNKYYKNAQKQINKLSLKNDKLEQNKIELNKKIEDLTKKDSELIKIKDFSDFESSIKLRNKQIKN
ncbi:MAG: AAA family ATPase, partial [Candidatus Hodarchaeota archaeon]